jgi:ubiquinone/menaquinone biosynthesis C-methylase UbiE
MELSDFLLNKATNSSFELIEIRSGIPRFVHQETYAENFGVQWNEFRKVQLDSFTNIPLSRDRLKRILGKHFDNLQEKIVLEAGCGAGRFTEVISGLCQNVVAVDISSAVDAAKLNLSGHKNNCFFIQADILDLPVKPDYFDAAICIGVLQHTPNSLESLREIVRCVKPGGWIFIDHYKLKFKNLYPPMGGFGNVFRLFVKRMEPRDALLITRKWVDFFFPLHWKFRNSSLIQQILFRISPVRFYYPWLGLKSRQDYLNWAILDTFDGSADKYKRRRTKRQLLKEINQLGVSNIEVWEGGNGLEARFQKQDEEESTISG